jgi:hypothetical protein
VALRALISIAIFQLVNLVVAAMRAELSVAPADGRKVVDSDLIVAKGVTQICQCFEVLNHRIALTNRP